MHVKCNRRPPALHEFAPAAALLAGLAAGCGGTPAQVRYDRQDMETRKAVARLSCARTTLTLEELGETYPESVRALAERPFDPAYRKITEADAFGWERLREIEDRRRGAVERVRAETRERAKKAAEASEAEAKERKKPREQPDAAEPDAAETDDAETDDAEN